MPKFYLVTLGCAKNRIDSEVLLADLIGRGFEPLQQAEGADLVLINTCAFIQPAIEEAIDHLLSAAELKKEGKVGWVVGLGCLPERYGRDLAADMGEVDLFITAAALGRAGEKIETLMAGRELPRLIDSRPRFLYEAATPRSLTTPPGSAYVKIAEGCPNRCAYCTIPSIRGRQKSRPIEDIVAEAACLAQNGVQEINLVAQDLTAYGQDLDKAVSLKDLLRALEASPSGPPWIRLLYLNPARVDQDLLEIVASAKRILPYLDLPLQHAQPRIIKRMGRRPPADDILAWIKQVRESVPGVRLRTTFIVGYPGETEADFQALLNFAAEARFDHLGAFPFWPEPGTRAAELEAQVPQETAQERLDRLMETQRDISLEINQGWLGKTVDLLVEGRHPESDLLLAGRTWFQAPEVDGSAIIRAGTGQPGLIQQAKVVEAHPYDLIVELTETAADTPGS